MEREFLKDLIKERELFRFLEFKKINVFKTEDIYLEQVDFSDFYFEFERKYVWLKDIFFKMFKRFLLENDCSYEIFEREMKKQGNKLKPSVRNFAQIINNHLCWSRTSQGDRYWRNMHNKWAKYFSNIFILPLYGEYAANVFSTCNHM